MSAIVEKGLHDAGQLALERGESGCAVAWWDLARRWLPLVVMKATAASPVTPAGLHVLASHHRELDRRLEALIACARNADPSELRAEWSAFERELLRHLELEEAEILPSFARHNAVEARAILAEHAEIRNVLLELGLSLDLHLLRAEGVDAFVQRLKAHAHREDTMLYAWAQSHVAPEGWRSIKRGLRDAAKAARSAASHGARPA
jgi:hemerythrin-like domain-containing protein